MSAVSALFTRNFDNSKSPLFNQALILLLTAGMLAWPLVAVAQDDSRNETQPQTASAWTQSTFHTGVKMPRGLAVDKDGNVFVADWGNNRIVKVASNGNSATVAASIKNPSAIALDATGRMYISGVGTATVLPPIEPDKTLETGYRVFSGLPGKPLSFADIYEGDNCHEQGSTHNYSCEYTLRGATINGIALSGKSDANGNPYFYLSLGNGSIVSQSAIDAAFGDGQDDLDYLEPSFIPKGITFDASGNFYVVDGTFYQVRKVTPAGVWSRVGSGYNRPEGVAVDEAGNVFVADFGNNRVVEVTPAGVQTVLGTGLLGPTAVAVYNGVRESVFVSDSDNNRVVELEQ